MNPQSAIRNPQSCRRILVRGVNWLGDAVMSTPALLRLRERFPQTHITLLTPEKLRELWLHHPALDETISFEAGEGLFSVSRKLRAGNFDLALVLPNSPRSALEVWLANIPRRIGGARPWRNCFLTELVAPQSGVVEMHKRSVAEINQLIAGAGSHPASSIQYPASAHHLHQYLNLVVALGANPEPLPPRLVVTPEELTTATRKFDLATSSTNRPLFALNPGAEYGPAKRWPVERFAAAAREIQRRTDCTWLILGGEADAALAEQIISAIRKPQSAIRNLSGQTSLRELMSLLKLCRVLLTNDTGPMHVAAALGTPVVVPFGSTSPELTGPGLPGDTRHRLLKSDAPCSPCFLRECPIDFRCMNGISVERVVEAVLQITKTLNPEH
jgi:heptosyltransferase-2